jgi:hypothetical protein
MVEKKEEETIKKYQKGMFVQGTMKGQMKTTATSPLFHSLSYHQRAFALELFE